MEIKSNEQREWQTELRFHVARVKQLTFMRMRVLRSPFQTYCVRNVWNGTFFIINLITLAGWNQLLAPVSQFSAALLPWNSRMSIYVNWRQCMSPGPWFLSCRDESVGSYREDIPELIWSRDSVFKRVRLVLCPSEPWLQLSSFPFLRSPWTTQKHDSYRTTLQRRNLMVFGPGRNDMQGSAWLSAVNRTCLSRRFHTARHKSVVTKEARMWVSMQDPPLTLSICSVCEVGVHIGE